MKLEITQFLSTKVEFLGYVLRIGADKKRVGAMKEMYPSIYVKKLKHFLGLPTYFRNFIPDFIVIVIKVNH